MTEHSTVGMNGVAITRHAGADKRYRTYEVHQRRRVGEPRAQIHPRALIGDAYLADPYPTLAKIREATPCHRDWIGNAYWLTRYDDVTSVFVDDANFASRSKRSAYAFVDDGGRDFGSAPAVLRHRERILDSHTMPVASTLIDEFAERGGGDLALAFAARLPLELLAMEWGIPAEDKGAFAACYWRAQRGVVGTARVESDGRAAYRELIAYFTDRLAVRRADPGDDLVSLIMQLDPGVTAADMVATLIETDHASLHGALANLWFLLLTHPEAFEQVRDAREGARAMKLAYLETLRHSTPVLSAQRFARHEVERFGLLLPEGALVVCSAAAANRDPTIFANPDTFIVGRKDLTQREPRGMYRADGLASGIAFGLGAPSKQPALPEDGPRSRYAFTRDAAVASSSMLIERFPRLALAPGAIPRLTSLAIGEMHTCWHLPVVTNGAG